MKSQASLPLSYVLTGQTREPEKVKGFDNDYREIRLGRGAAVWEAAKKALLHWQMFPQRWTRIYPAKPALQKGNEVLISARFAGIWWTNSARIVYVIDEDRRFGFAYGTLPGHLERGEEQFLVRMDEHDNVFYSVKAFSRPRHWLAKICYPMVRRLQGRFGMDSLAQMQQPVMASLQPEPIIAASI